LFLLHVLQRRAALGAEVLIVTAVQPRRHRY
jgi:hypothetical protein